MLQRLQPHWLPASSRRFRDLLRSPANRVTVALLCLLAVLLAPQLAIADPEFDSDELIVGLQPGTSINAFNATWGTTTLDSYAEADLYLLSVAGLSDPQVEALELDPAVRYADANVVNDTPEGVRQLVIIAVGGEYVDYEDQQITERIGLDLAHSQSTGSGIVIGVLDTGVDPSHPALVGRLTPGYDFVDSDAAPWEVANGLDDDGDTQIDEGFGHGTMVAGILALTAPDAQLMPVRVLGDDGRASTFDICKGIQYAVRHGADILNLSLGVPVEMEALERQLEYAKDNDVVIVAAAGNESRSAPPFYPAAEGMCVMVTAVDSLDTKADFADWGYKVDICAPGTGVRSAFPGGGWALGSGCSFATPFVAGTAALIRSAHPGMGQGYVRDLVQDAADDIESLSGNLPFGGGLGSGRLFAPWGLMTTASTGEWPSAFEAALSLVVTPNPLVRSATLQLDLPGSDIGSTTGETGRLEILDPIGRHIAWLDMSEHGTWSWDGTDDRGRRVPSGRYLALTHTASGEPVSAGVTLLR